MIEVEGDESERKATQAPGKRRWRLRIFAGVVLAVVALALWPSNEPSYDGYTVTEWIRDFQKAQVAGRNGVNDYQENEAMRELGSEAVPYIVKELKAEDSGLTQATRRLLEKQSFFSIPFTAKQRREGARDALGALRKVDPKFAKDLIPFLDSKDVEDQVAVAYVLGGSQSTEALPKLIEMTSSSVKRVRLYAIVTLGNFREEHAIVTPVLVRVMNDPDPSVSGVAAKVLGELGPQGRAAIPDLVKALENANLLPSVAVALSKIDPEFDFENRVAPLLVAGLSESEPFTGRYTYAAALGELGAKAESALPALKGFLETEDKYLRSVVSQAIKKFEWDLK